MADAGRPPLVVGGFLVRAGRVLLGLSAPHRRIWPDVWDCIGGHLDAGETAEAALEREFVEEIGVRPTRYAALGDVPVDATEVCRLYRIDAWLGGEPHLANDEHVELRWFTPDEASALPNLALDTYRTLFQQLAAT
jgi:8-oxo-dGTP pyrophosphatase MutT (NUDIX family)